MVVVVCALVVTLAALVASDMAKPEAHLKILGYTQTEHFADDVVILVVTVANDGTLVGNATIRCEVLQNGVATYGSQNISLNPGAVSAYGIYVDIFADTPMTVTVKLYKH